jgi:hypothetical protein
MEAHVMPDPCFLNLSNHPVGHWSSAQVESALALGYGPVREPPEAMPQVDPTASTAQIETIAEALAERAVQAGARAAFVATDFTLTVALVRALQRRGVATYSTTARRVAREEVGADGRVEKRSVFSFCAWRAFPQIG